MHYRSRAGEKAHRAYLEAGADIIRTNTYASTSITQGKYRLENMTYDIALAGARAACEAIAEYNDDVRNCKTGKLGQVLERKYVAGCMGPTDLMASVSRDSSDPSLREVSFHELVNAYSEVARGLLDGGSDILLLENVRDALNVKAALYAIAKVCNDRAELVPIVVVGEVNSADGRVRAGQTVSALWHSISSFSVFCFGLMAKENVDDVLPHLKKLGDASVRLCVMTNVVLDGMNPHDGDSVKSRAKMVWRFADEGLVNIVGGNACATPDTIRFMVKALKGCRTRRAPAHRYNMLLSGLETLNVGREGNCVLVGANRNSKILSVNLDAGDKIAEAGLARNPVMVQSQKWDMLVTGMESVQGKGIARSISLSEGEEIFLVKASEIRKRGFAVVCLAEDEKGVATTFARETEIIERMYRLLVGKLNFLAEDIVFEPCVNDGEKPFEDAVNLLFKVSRFVKANLPYAHVLGDIDKLGLDFDDEEIQAGLHSVFLHHAKKAGLDFAAVNAGLLPAYEEIPYRQCCALEDVVLSRVPDAMKKLRAFIASRL